LLTTLVSQDLNFTAFFSLRKKSMLINLDYDGVIVDSFEPLLDLCVRAQQSLGVGRAPTREDFRTITNLTIHELGKLIGLPENLAPEYENEFFRLQQGNWKVGTFPDMVPVILELAKKHTLVIITAGQSDIVTKTLHEFGLGNAISKVLGGDLGLTKAERIEQSRCAFKIDPVDSLMVGDAISDMRQGKRAGVKTVAVTWGFQKRELLVGESPDYIIDHPKDLLKIAE
jgi:phosphoglycolate phosphatase